MFLKYLLEFFVFLPLFFCATAACSPPAVTVLDVSSEEATTFTVDRYFSACLYGPTQQFFNFGSENSVLRVRFDTDDPDFEPTISIYIFSPELDAKQIDKWINNQHSDAIHGDAPVPIYTRELEPTEYAITATELIDSSAGTYGDEYDNYRVHYSINDIVEDGRFQLISFDEETVVHIRTKACG